MLAGYQSYASSGLPWAPQIPESWQVQRNGRLFSHRVETGYPDLPILEVSLRTGVSVRDMVNGKRKQVMSAKEKYKRAVKGDIAYNMMRMWQGAVGPAPTDGLVSPAYVVVKPHAGVNTAYYSYLYRTAAYMREVNKFSRGIVADRNRLYWESFKQMPSLVPSQAEQDQIVAYLRTQDAHIARFIKAKRDLIALLNEQKLRIIDQAVTNGLCAFGKLEPSRSEWLGDVPNGWEVCRLKTKLLLNDGGCWGSDPVGEGGTPVLRSTEQRVDGTWSIESPALRLLGPIEASAKRLRTGDLVVTKSSGSHKHIGKTSLVTTDVEALNCCFSNFMQRLRPSPGTQPKWIWYLLNSGIGRVQMAFQSNSTTGLGNLSRETIGNLWFAFPPKDIQEKVIEALERELSPVECAIDVARRQISLVRDYRDRQIADLVTGQVDVRSWQPGPDDLITEEDLTALGDDDDDNDTTEEETDGHEQDEH